MLLICDEIVYNKMKKGDIVERYGSTKVDTDPTNPTNKLK